MTATRGENVAISQLRAFSRATRTLTTPLQLQYLTKYYGDSATRYDGGGGNFSQLIIAVVSGNRNHRPVRQVPD